ncbi:MAG: serine protease [Gemmatimonadaceae bacterium]
MTESAGIADDTDPLTPFTTFDRSAIVLIEAFDATGQNVSRGTGTLVAPSLVLTALHVVAFRKSESLTPKGVSLRLTFQGGTSTTGAIVSDGWDPKDDWALIELAESSTVAPMKLASLAEDDREWKSFGFPDAQPDGMVISGKVEAANGTFEQVDALQLMCTQVGAGAGGMSKGLSGAPVVIDGHLVGVMRAALMKDGRTEMATLYACPVRAILKKKKVGAGGTANDLWAGDFGIDALPRIDRNPLGTQIAELTRATGRQSLVFAGAAAGGLGVVLAGALALEQMRMPRVHIEGTVDATAVRFTVAPATVLPLQTSNVGRVDARSVVASGLTGLTYPSTSGGRIASITDEVFLGAADSTGPSMVAVDLTKPSGADTLFSLRAESVGTYLLVFAGAAVPGSLPMPVRSGALMETHDGTTTDITFPPLPGTRVASDSVEVRRAAAPLKLLVTLMPEAPAMLRLPLTAKGLDFAASARNDKNDNVDLSSVVQAAVRLDGSTTDMRLNERDKLVIPRGTLSIDGLTLSADRKNVQVTFSGEADSLSLSDGGALRNGIPTRLEHLMRVALIPALLGGAVLAAAVTFGLLALARNRRRA